MHVDDYIYLLWLNNIISRRVLRLRCVPHMSWHRRSCCWSWLSSCAELWWRHPRASSPCSSKPSNSSSPPSAPVNSVQPNFKTLFKFFFSLIPVHFLSTVFFLNFSWSLLFKNEEIFCNFSDASISGHCVHSLLLPQVLAWTRRVSSESELFFLFFTQNLERRKQFD